MTQNHRGTTTRKIVSASADQAMPKSHDWPTFLNNGDNNTANPIYSWQLEDRDFPRNLKISITITCG